MSPPEPLEATDLILLLLAAGGSDQANALNGITRLEKLLFLASKEAQIDSYVVDAFHFKPYDYGPYAKEIYEGVEILEQAGLLREWRKQDQGSIDEMEEVAAAATEREGVERRFELTPDGVAVASLLGSQHRKAADALTRIRRAYGRLPLRQLIRYVYTRYPAYAEASVIRDDVLR